MGLPKGSLSSGLSSCPCGLQISPFPTLAVALPGAGGMEGGREDQCISSLRPGAGSTPPHNRLPPIPEPTQERPLWLREGGASAAQEKRSRAPPSGSPGNTSLCVSRGPGPTLQAATKPLHHRNHKTTPRDPTNGCSLDGEEDQDSLHSQLPSACDLGSSQPGHFSAWFCLLCQGCHLPCPRSRFLTAVKAPASQPLWYWDGSSLPAMADLPRRRTPAKPLVEVSPSGATQRWW